MTLDANISTSPSNAAETNDVSEHDLLVRFQRAVATRDKQIHELARKNASISMKLGSAVVASRTSVLLMLKLPWTIYRIVSRHRPYPKQARQTLPVSYAEQERHRRDDFVRREPRWFSIDLGQQKALSVEGTVVAKAMTNPRGAVVTIRYLGDRAVLMEQRDERFLADGSFEYSSYFATGNHLAFRINLQPPAFCRCVEIGFKRYGQATPIYVEISAIAVGAPGERGEDVGLSPMLRPYTDVQPRFDLPTVAVLDEFTESCLRHELPLRLVGRDDWQEGLASAKLVFAESVWRGNNGRWSSAMTKLETRGEELQQLLAASKSRSIPTVFWNKEDPVNFDVFKDAARLFDYVFTTDEQSVDAYRALGCVNVGVLPFAAQPIIHNPIGSGERCSKLAFTGSWRGLKYPDRAEALDQILLPLVRQGRADIYDRYAAETENPDLMFPHTYRAGIIGSLAYDELVRDVYKGYAGFVNVNSVTDSSTMLSRRVYEVLACGAPVISSPSRAIDDIFGDIVIQVANEKEAVDAADRLLDDHLYRDGLAVRGVRHVLSAHTYERRIRDVLTTVGLGASQRPQRKISAVVCSKRPRFLAQVAAQLRAQTYTNFEVIFVIHDEGFDPNTIETAFSGMDLKILHNAADSFLGDGLNKAVAAATGDIIAKIDDDDYYGPNYFYDAMLAFDYAPSAGVVGKQAFFAYVESLNQTVHRFPGKSYRFSKRVQGGTIMFDRKKVGDIGFQSVRQGTDTLFLNDCLEREIPILSTDPFNFIHVRYADTGQHTWRISDADFASNTKSIGTGLRLDVVMI